MALTHDDVKSLVSIIDNAEHLEEIEIGWGNFQIHLWRSAGAARAAPASAPGPAPARAPVAPSHDGDGASNPPSAPSPASAAQPPAELALADGDVVIRAPMLGTFYRAASPGEPPYAEVGQRVGASDTVCLIEVMKLFNSIRAGVDGTVTRILRENATLVEFDEPIMVIRRASATGS